VGKPRRTSTTPDLFEPDAAIPAGFRYQLDFLSAEEERELVAHFADLSFRPFEFQGYLGNRRVVSFGWKYDFNTRELRKADDIPEFLAAIRARAADFAGLARGNLQQVLLTEYAPGSGIGWHRDKAVFGEVVGISLLSACTFRFRRKQGAGWERASIVAAPRSAYLLQGPSRTEWQHSIPPVDSLRYSVTFRNLISS
jgi:alkylated DNA repair dioxygenase AlkB